MQSSSSSSLKYIGKDPAGDAVKIALPSTNTGTVGSIEDSSTEGDKPARVKVLRKQGQNVLILEADTEGGPWKMRLNLSTGDLWTLGEDEDGIPYKHEDSFGVTVGEATLYSDPVKVVARAGVDSSGDISAGGISKQSADTKARFERLRDHVNNKAGSKVTTTAELFNVLHSTATPKKRAAAGGGGASTPPKNKKAKYTQHLDPVSGNWFYVDAVTGETTWERPETTPPAKATKAAAPALSGWDDVLTGW